jgi:hypothetical protein
MVLYSNWKRVVLPEFMDGTPRSRHGMRRIHGEPDLKKVGGKNVS